MPAKGNIATYRGDEIPWDYNPNDLLGNFNAPDYHSRNPYSRIRYLSSVPEVEDPFPSDHPYY